MDYEQRTYRLPASREDDLVAELWRRGALGCEVQTDDQPGRARLIVYFPAGAAPTLDPRWRRLGVEDLGGDAFAERDWLADYRAKSRPLAVGRHFLVDPRDVDDAAAEDTAADDTAAESYDAEGRRILRIPAQNAFGTGSHGSTRLTVDLLEAHADVVTDATVLDVGTGSGILAFVVLHLGARQVIGYDLDAPSVVTAHLNARRNVPAHAPAWFAGTTAALAPGGHFDLAVVNILPERIIDDYPALVAQLKPGGRVISSGNLVEQRDSWLNRLAPFGLELEAERTDGEWIAFLLRKP